MPSAFSAKENKASVAICFACEKTAPGAKARAWRSKMPRAGEPARGASQSLSSLTR